MSLKLLGFFLGWLIDELFSPIFVAPSTCILFGWSVVSSFTWHRETNFHSRKKLRKHRRSSSSVTDDRDGSLPAGWTAGQTRSPFADRRGQQQLRWAPSRPTWSSWGETPQPEPSPPSRREQLAADDPSLAGGDQADQAEQEEHFLSPLPWARCCDMKHPAEVSRAKIPPPSRRGPPGWAVVGAVAAAFGLQGCKLPCGGGGCAEKPWTGSTPESPRRHPTALQRPWRTVHRKLQGGAILPVAVLPPPA